MNLEIVYYITSIIVVMSTNLYWIRKSNADLKAYSDLRHNAEKEINKREQMIVDMVVHFNYQLDAESYHPDTQEVLRRKGVL